MIKINMNEQCKVKLTPYGEQILVNHYTEAYSADDVRRMIEQIHKPNIVTGYTFSMWELFKIFGPTCFFDFADAKSFASAEEEVVSVDEDGKVEVIR